MNKKIKKMSSTTKQMIGAIVFALFIMACSALPPIIAQHVSFAKEPCHHTWYTLSNTKDKEVIHCPNCNTTMEVTPEQAGVLYRESNEIHVATN